jgi:hypothetical protein
MSAPRNDNWQHEGSDPTGGTPAYSSAPSYEMAAYGSAPVPRSRRLGRVALLLALLALFGSLAVSIFVGLQAGPYTARTSTSFSMNLDLNSSVPGEAALALVWTLGWVVCTVLGVWAFVQGIVATATRRGRAAGIAAIVIAALAPGLSAVVALIVVGLNH